MKNKEKSKNFNPKKLLVLFPVLIILISVLLITDYDLNAGKEKFTINSHDNTNFPLTGKHRTAQCSECHLKGVIQNTPTDCEACHWERKQDDRYNLQLGLHCDDCHTTFAWKKLKPNSWDHSVETGFKREGTHKTLDCFNCHKDSFHNGLTNECVSCHLKDYEKADEPDHRINNFPRDCMICHQSQFSWENSVFDHTAFPLEGIHKTLDCTECHKNGKYAGTSPDCFSCHSNDYNSTNDPNHKKAGFPTDCVMCHKSMTTWAGASFSHLNFQLLGAHKTLDCLSCHNDGVYQGRSTACVSCHLGDYNKTKDPNHLNVGFPTNCESCHSANHISWDQAVFNHNFPITSGDHRGFSCTDCHISANYNQFSCTDCHEHNKTEMDKEHDDVGGYVYNSQNCYSCHPNGDDD